MPMSLDVPVVTCAGISNCIRARRALVLRASYLRPLLTGGPLSVAFKGEL